MSTDSSGAPEFSLAQARACVQDLFEPNPRIYFVDFLASFALGSAAYTAVRLIWENGPSGFGWKLLAVAAPFIISVLMYYRCSLFIHEIVHFKAGTMRPFSWMWNLLCGIPFLIPSFVYQTHVDHHRRRHFGTEKDGEYLSFSHQPPSSIVWSVLASFVLPPLAVLRFLVITPLTWFVPPFRRWIHQHASSMVMDPSYLRPLPTAEALRQIRMQEVLVFLWLVGIFVAAAVVHGRLPYPFFIHAYFTAVGIITLNILRTLGSHRWTNDGEEMTFLAQMLDSVNYDQRPYSTVLWGPIGTRFHALHHLFPSMPYHSLGKAHRRLMEQLPEDSPYRQTTSTHLRHEIAALWRRASSPSNTNPPAESPSGRLAPSARTRDREASSAA